MIFDKNLFIEKLTNDTRQLLEKIRICHSNEDVIAFALYSDDSACTICSSFNTLEYLNQCQTEDDDDCYMWCTAEWKYEHIYPNEFSSSNGYLRECIKTVKDGHYEQFSNSIFESFVSVLASLKEEVRAQFGTNCLVLFNISDTSRRDLLIKSNNKLNPSNVALKFQHWVETEK
jgi:hypothetical protein